VHNEQRELDREVLATNTDDAGRVVSRWTYATALQDAELWEMDADRAETSGNAECVAVLREEATAVREAVASRDTETLRWFCDNGFFTTVEVLDPSFEGGCVHTEWVALPVAVLRRVFYPARTVHGRVARAGRGRRVANRRRRATRAGPSRLADDPDPPHLAGLTVTSTAAA
jgi:hypothetical protein